MEQLYIISIYSTYKNSFCSIVAVLFYTFLLDETLENLVLFLVSSPPFAKYAIKNAEWY